MTEQQAIFMQLVARRTALSLQSEIPDFAAYAEEWSKLSADFADIGSFYNVALCESNWQRYKPLEGEYIRLNYDNYSELIPIGFATADAPQKG